jgi:hypothetical protein
MRRATSLYQVVFVSLFIMVIVIDAAIFGNPCKCWYNNVNRSTLSRIESNRSMPSMVSLDSSETTDEQKKQGTIHIIAPRIQFKLPGNYRKKRTAKLLRRRTDFRDDSVTDVENKEHDCSRLPSLELEHAKNADDMITFDVSGTQFLMSRSNLSKVKGSYFHAMFVSGDWLPNEVGSEYMRSFLSREIRTWTEICLSCDDDRTLFP